MRTLCTLCTQCTLSSCNCTMFQAHHHLNFRFSRDSTLATLQYDWLAIWAEWAVLLLSEWSAVVGRFTTAFSGAAGRRNVSRHMVPNPQPTVPQTAHRSCEYSRPVSRSMPASLFVQEGAMFHVNCNSTMFLKSKYNSVSRRRA